MASISRKHGGGGLGGESLQTSTHHNGGTAFNHGNRLVVGDRSPYPLRSEVDEERLE